MFGEQHGRTACLLGYLGLEISDAAISAKSEPPRVASHGIRDLFKVPSRVL